MVRLVRAQFPDLGKVARIGIEPCIDPHLRNSGRLSSRDMPLPTLSVALHYLSRFGQPRELTDDLLLRKHERGHSFPLKHLFNVEAEDLLLALLW